MIDRLRRVRAVKRATALLIAALLLGSCAVFVRADTGTYRILDYRVKLTPHSDGKVAIDYYQKWRVTGGHIPWVTIGVPNENTEQVQGGLNASAATDASTADWSGVRLDLDRDYQPGQEFEVGLSLVQNRLFYADDKDYKLDFTPGWYDRAPIDHLEIRVKFYVKPELVTATPAPASKTQDELTWIKDSLGEGERFSISVAFPRNAYAAQGIPEDNLKQEVSAGTAEWLAILVVIAFIVMVIAALAWYYRGGGRYTGGGIFFGGSGYGDGGARGRSSGGGGGFGGAGISCACACACVSCACACACAGGGAAGCSRKTRHTCRACTRGARP
jgi:hypothetical protein